MFNTTSDLFAILLARATGGGGGGGGGGTSDYSQLSNKPKINNVELDGNKSLADIGAQPTIDSSHKLSADNVDDTSTTNKFATAAQLDQIRTNENNILSIQQTIGDINTVLEEVL